SVSLQTGSRRNQLTDDNIFLQAYKVVHLALDSGLGKNLGRLLEGCRGQEGICSQGGFGDTKHNLFSGCRSLSFFFQLLVHILEFQNVHKSTRKEFGITVFLNTDLLQHLAYKNLDMLIADLNALQTVYSLNFAEHVILSGADALDPQDVMRIHTTFCQLVAGFQHLSVRDLDTGSVGDQVSLRVAVFRIGDDDLAFLLGVVDHSDAGDLGDDRKTLR